MRKLYPVLGFVFVLGFLAGCGEEGPVAPPEPPTNLTIAVTGDSLSVVLDWDPSPTADIDGYRVYVSAGDTTLVYEVTESEITIEDAPIADYYVVAYKGDVESDPSNTVTTIPVEEEDVGPVYNWRASGPSGFRWNEDGSYDIISMTAEDTVLATIDFYIDTLDFMNSPDIYNTEWKTTGIMASETAYDNLAQVPAGDFLKEVQIQEGTFVFKLNVGTDNVHFVKMEITEYQSTGDYSEHYIKFRYAYQLVPGFKKF